MFTAQITFDDHSNDKLIISVLVEEKNRFFLYYIGVHVTILIPTLTNLTPKHAYHLKNSHNFRDYSTGDEERKKATRGTAWVLRGGKHFNQFVLIFFSLSQLDPSDLNNKKKLFVSSILLRLRFRLQLLHHRKNR